MVSPITVIDKTSNDDDEIILNLNLEMTIDDYDTDGRKNDALAEAAASGRASTEAAAAEAERAVATAKAATERAAAAERAASAEIATAKAAAAKAAAEITAVKAAAEIAAAKAAAEMAALKTAAERAADERAAVEKDVRRHKINIHVAGRIYPSAAPHLSLTVRDGKVILSKSDDSDSNQHWYRFQKYSTGIKDVEGRPSFIFENNGTGLTLQHAIRNDNPVRLIKHNFNEINRSVLWTRGQIVDGAFTIRSVDDIRLELVIHNHNYQEGEKIISYNFHGANHHYWKFTYWKLGLGKKPEKPDRKPNRTGPNRKKIENRKNRTENNRNRKNRKKFGPVRFWTGPNRTEPKKTENRKNRTEPDRTEKTEKSIEY